MKLQLQTSREHSTRILLQIDFYTLNIIRSYGMSLSAEKHNAGVSYYDITMNNKQINNQ